MLMLNEQFAVAVKAVKAIDSKGKGLFNALRDYVMAMGVVGIEEMRGYFKAQEQLATTLMKVNMTQNSTYKVAKGKLLKAIELGVSLTDSNGKPLGKTALEDAIKAASPAPTPASTPFPVSPFDQCMVALGVVSDESKKIPDSDIALLCGPVQALLDQLSKRTPVAIAA